MAHEGAQKRQRSCIGCGEVLTKGRLHRVVRASDGSVDFDPTGRVAGRGAYVCSGACLALARKNRKLERALRCKVTEEDYDRIQCALDSVGAAGRIEE